MIGVGSNCSNFHKRSHQDVIVGERGGKIIRHSMTLWTIDMEIGHAAQFT